MKRRYRIVKVDWRHPYRVQESALLPLGWLLGWRFARPYSWYATAAEAKADIERRQGAKVT